jgi:NAD(P)-dependent dehydrogenase (short-subunit alcohol dehydrogenase family)
MRRFTGKTILITGAARGIGRAAAREFAREGGLVYATDIDAAALVEMRADLDAEGLEVAIRRQDASSDLDWAATITAVTMDHGHLDRGHRNRGMAPVDGDQRRKRISGDARRDRGNEGTGWGDRQRRLDRGECR